MKKTYEQNVNYQLVHLDTNVSRDSYHGGTGYKLSSSSNGSLRLSDIPSGYPNYLTSPKISFNGNFDDVFSAMTSGLRPYEGMITNFEEAFYSYLELDDASFSEAIEFVGRWSEVDSIPNFLQLSFADLFEVPVNEKTGELDYAENSRQMGEVINVSYDLPPYQVDAIPVQSDPNEVSMEPPQSNLDDDEDDENITLTDDGEEPNYPPMAMPDFSEVFENAAQFFNGLLDNDSDRNFPDERLRVIEVNGIPITGTAILTDGGALINVEEYTGYYLYDPNGAYNYLSSGEFAFDTITYKISDLGGLTSTSTLTVKIIGVNNNIEAGAVNDLSGNAIEDTNVVPVDLLQDSGIIEFTDQDLSDTHSVSTQFISSSFATQLGVFDASLTTPATNGQVGSVMWNFELDNNLIQFLAENQTIIETYSVSIEDGNGDVLAQDVQITITGTNDAPVANDQSINATEDGPVVLTAFDADDVDSDNDPTNLTYQIVNPLGVGEGTVAVLGNNFEYDVGADFQDLAVGETRDVSFTYKAIDVHGAESGTQTVTVTVTGVNDAPVANDQVINATEDGPAVLGVFNADDVDSDDNQASLTYQIIDNLGMGEGSVVNNKNGTFSYDPGNDFQELALDEKINVSFTYKATDQHGAESGIQTVTVTITGENDAPVANNQSINAIEDGAVVVTAFDADDVDSDNNQNNLTYQIVGALGAGEGSVNITGNTFEYDVGADFQDLAVGQTRDVSFTYKAIDVHGAESGVQTVTVTVTGVNDAPTLVGDTGSVSEDGVLTDSGNIVFNDIDSIDINTLSVASADGLNTIKTINDLPNGNKNTSANVVVDGMYGQLILNGDGSWNYNLANGNSNVQALAKNQMVQENFAVSYSDGFGSADGAIVITLTGENDAPVANDQSINATEDGPVVLTAFDANDVDSDNDQTNLTYQIVNPLGAGEGTVAVIGNTFEYDVGADFQDLAVGETRDVSFTYKAIDVHGAESSVQTVTVTVTGINDAPTLVGDTGSVSEDGVLSDSGNIVFNDIDSIDVNTLSVVSADGLNTTKSINDLANGNKNTSANVVVSGKYGQLTLNGDGTWNYVLANGSINVQALAENQVVQENFAVSYSDDFGSANGAIVITITGDNDTPVANNDSYNINADSILNIDSANSVLNNDIDIDTLDTITAYEVNGVTANIGSQIALGSGALLTVQADGSFIYDPNDAFDALPDGNQSVDTFNYRAIDNNSGISNLSTVSITVTGVSNFNAVDDAYLVDQNSLESYALTFTFDVSGSLVDGVNNGNGVEPSVFDSVVAALNNAGNLIDTYNDNSADLYFTIIRATSGTLPSITETFTSVQDAKDYIASLATNSGSGSNYSNGLNAGVAALTDNSINPALSGYKQVSYFFGDDDSNISLTAETNWQNAITNNNVQSYAVNLSGPQINLAELSKIPTQTNDPLVIQSADILNDLSDLLGETVTTLEGNIITNDALGDNLPVTVTGFTYHDGVNPNAAGSLGVEVTTNNGGTFILHDNGDFVYTQPSGGFAVNTLENFNYTIEDALTNTSSASLSITVEATPVVPPVIIDLNGDGLSVTSLENGIYYDIDNDNSMEKVSWVKPGDGILAVDLNGNGSVDSALEFVFTNHAPEAKTDLEAIRVAFDSNQDGVLNSLDEFWESFGIWQDFNQDGISQEGEFSTLSTLGFRELLLESNGVTTLVNGNIVYGQTSLVDNEGSQYDAYDVGLAYQEVSDEQANAHWNLPVVNDFASLYDHDLGAITLSQENTWKISEVSKVSEFLSYLDQDKEADMESLLSEQDKINLLLSNDIFSFEEQDLLSLDNVSEELELLISSSLETSWDVLPDQSVPAANIHQMTQQIEDVVQQVVNVAE